MADSNMKWFKDLFADAKNHIIPEDMDDYIFSRKELSSEKIKFIENHLTSCQRCKSQVQDVNANKIYYSTLPTLDRI